LPTFAQHCFTYIHLFTQKPLFLMGKIPKFKKAPNVYMKMLGVMLISSVFFVGCRQREVLPEPNTEAHKALTIAQAKNWFNRYKALLRSQKTTTDSVEREPDWQKIAYQATTGGTSDVYLEMPLRHNQKYLAFRKTDEQGRKFKGVSKVVMKQMSATEFKPVVVQLFADSTFLAQSNTTLLQSTFTHCPPNFTGEALFYDWETGVLIGGNKFEQGVLTATVQAFQEQQRLVCVTYPVIAFTASPEDAAGSRDGVLGDPYVTNHTVCWQEGVSAGGGGGYNGGYGGGAGSGVFNPNPTPVPIPEPPGVTLDSSMTDKANKKIKCVWDKLKQMPEIKNLLNGYGTSAGFTLNIKVFDLPDEGDLGQTTTLNDSYPPDFSRVEIRLDPALLQSDKSAIEVALTIIHEMLHARMYAKIANGGGVNNIPISVPNFYAELQKYGFGSPADYKYNEAGHEYMAKWEIDELASLVALYDGATVPSLGHKMMVWQGLYDTFRYEQDAFPDEESRDAQKNYAENFKKSKLNEPACK
jgi:hypothetical protein